MAGWFTVRDHFDLAAVPFSGLYDPDFIGRVDDHFYRRRPRAALGEFAQLATKLRRVNATGKRRRAGTTQ
jgi:hypothetical protein